MHEFPKRNDGSADHSSEYVDPHPASSSTFAEIGSFPKVATSPYLTPSAQMLSHRLQSLGVRPDIVVGIEELEMSNPEQNYLSHVNRLVALLEAHSFPTNKLGTFFGLNSSRAIQLPPEQFEDIIAALGQVGLSMRQIEGIVKDRSGLTFLEISQRFGAAHIKELVSVLENEFGGENAKTMISFRPTLLRIFPNWLRDNIASFRDLFGPDHLNAANDLCVSSHGQIFLYSNDTRAKAFEFYDTVIFEGDSSDTRAAVCNNWRMLRVKRAALEEAWSCMVKLVGEEAARTAAQRRPILVSRVKPETMELLADLGFDINEILLQGKVRFTLTVYCV